MVKVKKLGNIPVKIIPLDSHSDKRKVKGFEIFNHNDPFTVTGIFAQRGSGKTNLIANLLEKKVGPNSTIIIFANTVNNDPIYLKIQKDFEKRGVPVICHNSIVDDKGVDILRDYIESLKFDAEEAVQKAKDGKVIPSSLICTGNEEEETDELGKKTKLWSADYIFVFDDISENLKIRSFNTFCKQSRHYHCDAIMASQSVNDVPPGLLNQLTHVVLFQGLPKEKELHIIKNCHLNATPEQFLELYNYATNKRFDFLFINTISQQYRHNFDEELQL